MQNTEIKAKIAELRQNYERLKRQCSSSARINPTTITAYYQEIKELESQLN